MSALPRCPCGASKFAERVDRTRHPAAERWRVVSASGGGTGGGLGATPFGSLFGAGLGIVEAPVLWGRFTMPITTGIRNLFCLSCQRIRRGLPVGGGTAMAVWREDDFVFALMTDVVSPACMAAQFVFEGDAHHTTIEVLPVADAEVPPPVGLPELVRAAAPINATIPKFVYRVPIPIDVDTAQAYRLTFVDRCLSTTQNIYAFAGVS